MLTKKPVKIDDLARDLIKLSGYTPDIDIKIEYVGLRPGEKLYEETLTAEEGISSSSHKKIFIAKPEEIDENKFYPAVEKLMQLSESKDFERTPAEMLVKTIVPSFMPGGKQK